MGISIGAPPGRPEPPMAEDVHPGHGRRYMAGLSGTPLSAYCGL